MLNPFDRRAKTAPSHYPRVPFHLLRCAQLVSSLIVGSIMIYFIWHLHHDHWPTPWTFILLLASSLFSVAALVFTVVLHCFIGLAPRLNLAINGFLSILWAVGWSLLTWYMSPTLSHYCDVENWHEDTGIMVCRIYKALFTFSLTGLLSTFAAFALDIYVRRQQTSRGLYKLHDLDNKRPEGSRPAFTDNNYANRTLDEPRESEAWEAPRPSMGPYGEQSDGQLHVQGYAVPEGQFGYDTGYHGGHRDAV